MKLDHEGRTSVKRYYKRVSSCITTMPVLKVCSCCGKSKSKEDYSSNQWKKKQSLRCRDCVTSDKPPLMNKNNDADEDDLLVLGQPNTLFCSSALQDKISLDESGNAILNLGAVLGREDKDSPLDLCANAECRQPHSKLRCARCKRIVYCSKECQVADWRRHKHAECEAKSKKKIEVLEIADPRSLDEASRFAQDNMLESVKKLGEDVAQGRSSGELESWKHLNDQTRGLSESNSDTSFDEELLKNFVFRCYAQLAGFAAVHIDKYPHLKGSLFLFSKVSIYDLCADGTSELDRCFALMWGCRPVRGEAQPPFSARYLAAEFLDQVKTLPLHMEHCCDRESFTIVFCCDPSGSLLPEVLRASLPLPANVDPFHYIHETPAFTTVARFRFFSFVDALQLGRQFPEMEVLCLNMDRGVDDSSSRQL